MQYPKALNESFLQLLAHTGMEQLVDFPTHGDNTLDIIITNRPSLINRCEGMPGLSDHNVVYADWNAQAKKHKPIHHKIYLWKRTNLDEIRLKTKRWTENFVSSYTSSTPVDVLAREIQQHLEKTLQDQVPSKYTTTRFNQPWYNTATKRICRRKARAWKKARRTNHDRDWRFRSLKKIAQTTCCQAYNQHITNIICSEPGGSKRLGATIKAMRCDRTGIAPLKDGNFLHSDPKSKANILNRQFASVFTNDSATSLPDLGPSPHPSMDNIHIHAPGITKLLKNLKPHKASGPDGVPARLLKETAEEICSSH